MAKRQTGAEELFGEAAIDFGWSKQKQVEILLGFIESQGLETELDEYVQQVGEDDDTEESDTDPFVSSFEDDE